MQGRQLGVLCALLVSLLMTQACLPSDVSLLREVSVESAQGILQLSYLCQKLERGYAVVRRERDVREIVRGCGR